MRIAGVTTAQHVVERRFQGTGHGSDLAVTDGVLVDGDNRTHLGGGATGKDLVGEIELGAVDVPLDDLQAKDFPCEHDQGIAGDALQDSTADIRSNDLIAGDEHHAGAGTLGNFSEMVQEDRGVVSVVPRLHAGELAIPIVGEILDSRWHDVLGDAAPGAHLRRLRHSGFEVGRHRRGIDQKRRLLAELSKALTGGIRGIGKRSDVGIFTNVVYPKEIDYCVSQLRPGRIRA